MGRSFFRLITPFVSDNSSQTSQPVFATISVSRVSTERFLRRAHAGDRQVWIEDGTEWRNQLNALASSASTVRHRTSDNCCAITVWLFVLTHAPCMHAYELTAPAYMHSGCTLCWRSISLYSCDLRHPHGRDCAPHWPNGPSRPCLNMPAGFSRHFCLSASPRSREISLGIPGDVTAWRW